MVRRIQAALLIVLLSGVVTDRVDACSCFGGPAFGAFARADEVFTGRVLSVTRDPLSEYQREIVRVQVLESLKGSAAGSIEVISETPCGFPFERGREYLVYGDYEGEVLTVHLCGRTRALDRAAADFSYIRGVIEGRSGSNVYGRAQRDRPDRDGSPLPRTPVRIVLTGEGRRFETSLHDGSFELNFIPPGHYRMSAIGATLVALDASPPTPQTASGIRVDGHTSVSLRLTLRVRD